MGLTPASKEKLWAEPTASDHNILDVNPLQKPLAHLARDFYKLQLLPGHRLETLSSDFIYFIDQSLRGDDLVNKRVPLMKWCGEVLIHAATESVFGERLLQIEPELISTFFDFNQDSWMLIYRQHWQ